MPLESPVGLARGLDATRIRDLLELTLQYGREGCGHHKTRGPEIMSQMRQHLEYHAQPSGLVRVNLIDHEACCGRVGPQSRMSFQLESSPEKLIRRRDPDRRSMKTSKSSFSNRGTPGIITGIAPIQQSPVQRLKSARML